MRLSDVIRALEWLKAKHGDLPVLEQRQVWYDGVSEFFPDGIEIDKRVRPVVAYHGNDKHHYDVPSNVPADAKDRREFTAFVL